MFSDIQLRPEMGEAVLEHLESKVSLPRFGVVAGQSVASAIEDLYGKGGGVYNDVDLFLPVKYGFAAKSASRASPLAGYSKAGIGSTVGYGGSVRRHLELVQTYSIEAVAYFGNLNKVYFRLPSKQDSRVDDHSRRLISGFDLNAVRVAVDLQTRKLVWDRHYEDFLTTRELKIAACYTPAHTLIRLLRKAQELPDVTVDVETATRITAMLHSEELFTRLKSSQLVAYFFGDKFTAQALALKPYWDSAYCLEEHWFNKASEQSGWREGCGDETTYDVKSLSRMSLRGELDAADQALASNLGRYCVVGLPEQVYRDRDRRMNALVSVLPMPDAEPDHDDVLLSEFARMHGPGYMDCVEFGSEEYCQLTDFLRHDTFAACVLGESAASQLQFMSEVRSLSASLPIAFMHSIRCIPGLEGSAGVRAEIARRLEAARKPVHAKAMPLPGPLPVELCGASVRELGTRLELEAAREQHFFAACEPATDWTSRYFLFEADVDGARAVLMKVGLCPGGAMQADHVRCDWGQGSAASRTRALLEQRAKHLVDWWAARALLVHPL